MSHPTAAPPAEINEAFIQNHAYSFTDAQLKPLFDDIAQRLAQAHRAVEDAKQNPSVSRPQIRELIKQSADVRQAQIFLTELKGGMVGGFIAGALWMRQLIPRPRD